MAAILEARGITKRFGQVLANDSINLTIEEGEIHTVVGENGAGKSTLMNILYGMFPPDEGEILFKGNPVHFASSADAIKLGIGMVHQHFMLVPPFTVTENILLGNEPRQGIKVDFAEGRKKVIDYSKRFGLQIDPDARVENISIGMQQRVEILKALFREAKVLILDEPTAVLTPQETRELFNILNALKEDGHTIIFITHKLKEVLAISDRISVIRDGRMVGEVAAGTSERELAKLMVGREVVLRVDKKEANPQDTVLEIRDLRYSHHNIEVLKGISFGVRAGEIFGIAGVEGNGQAELIEVITGLRKASSGHVYLGGEEITNLSPRRIREKGIAHIPSDRHQQGLFLEMTIEENLVAGRHYLAPFVRHGFFMPRVIRDFAMKTLDDFDVRPVDPLLKAGNLSGGNQQKVVIGREFNMDHKLLIAAQPTRGVDVGAIEFIHNLLIQRRDEGYAILLISAELSEIMSLSTRVGVIYNGQLQGVVDPDEVQEEEIGLMMAGHSLEEVLG